MELSSSPPKLTPLGELRGPLLAASRPLPPASSVPTLQGLLAGCSSPPGAPPPRWPCAALSRLPALVSPPRSSLQAPPSPRGGAARDHCSSHCSVLALQAPSSTQGTRSPPSSPDPMSSHLLSAPHRMPVLWASQRALGTCSVPLTATLALWAEFSFFSLQT